MHCSAYNLFISELYENTVYCSAIWKKKIQLSADGSTVRNSTIKLSLVPNGSTIQFRVVLYAEVNRIMLQYNFVNYRLVVH